jgi:uncharacterized protein YjbJ (UPF0337 family)
MSFMDKLKNRTERTTGKAKEQVGGATGNERMRAEGKNDQALGDLKDAGEKVKDAGGKLKDAVER